MLCFQKAFPHAKVTYSKGNLRLSPRVTNFRCRPQNEIWETHLIHTNKLYVLRITRGVLVRFLLDLYSRHTLSIVSISWTSTYRNTRCLARIRFSVHQESIFCRGTYIEGFITLAYMRVYICKIFSHAHLLVATMPIKADVKNQYPYEIFYVWFFSMVQNEKTLRDVEGGIQIYYKTDHRVCCTWICFY